jgi:hypothetical protein
MADPDVPNDATVAQSTVRHALEPMILDAFRSFTEDLATSGWRGKENDAVNRFAHGYLLPRCPTGIFRHPTQIGIEVGVPQPPGVGQKRAAKKDLVIWPEPWMSTWTLDWQPANIPTVVMEWKLCHARKRLLGCAHDRRWVESLARWQPGSLGLTVIVDLDARTHRLHVGRYFRDQAEPDWLTL